MHGGTIGGRAAWRSLALSLGALTLLVGCGDGDGASVADAVPLPKATVVLEQGAYRPARLEVPVGTRVTWVNGSDTDNTVETEGVGSFEYDRAAMARRGRFDLHILSGGEAESVVFERPGVYRYGSSLDSSMLGVVTVTGGAR